MYTGSMQDLCGIYAGSRHRWRALYDWAKIPPMLKQLHGTFGHVLSCLRPVCRADLYLHPDWIPGWTIGRKCLFFSGFYVK